MRNLDKYTDQGEFNLEDMLKALNIHQRLIDEIKIRKSVSELTKSFIEKLKQLDENENSDIM